MSSNKTLIKNTSGSTLKEKKIKMSEDQEQNIHPRLVHIMQKPHIQKQQGLIALDFIHAMSERYEATCDDICNNLFSVKFADLERLFKNLFKKASKSTKKKDEKLLHMILTVMEISF